MPRNILINYVLTKICQQQGVTNADKLGYLNAFVGLINDDSIDCHEYGFTSEELLKCLRIGLVQETTQVRAAALRAIRYLLKNKDDIILINKLNYPYFIARSMDIFIRNDIERIQALRVVRKILVISPNDISPILARSLISLCDDDVEDNERPVSVFLATLCELGILNSNLFINCGGTGTLLRSASRGLSSSMVESVVGVLLHLLTNPDTRNNISLKLLAAPYCELYTSKNDRSRVDREVAFTASKQALLSILRSYPGILCFCNPNDNSGIKAISDILYIEQLEVRGAVLELFYELLGLPLPVWTDEPDVALAAVDPFRPRNNWKLSEGFVAAEGKTILPITLINYPNLYDLHLSLLVYILIECGLHRALAETIVTSDTFISVRAAVLLGALLNLAHSLLPQDICDLTPPLPNLLEHASLGKHQALAAVKILERMHIMMKRKPIPSSLFLDKILKAGNWLRSSPPRRKRPIQSKTWLLKREQPITPLLKESQVLNTKDSLGWNWTAVRSILRSRDDVSRLICNSDQRIFLKRIVRYFKPSSNKYSRVELSTNIHEYREITLAGCDLINCLLELQQQESIKLLNELIGDITEQITLLLTLPSAHDCLFSPRHMTTTCCQKYFLFLGQLSQSAKGTVILKSFNLLLKLEQLALTTKHDCYVKLIVSSLDYTRDGPNRKILFKIITTNETTSIAEQKILYVIQFLRIILRAKMTDAFKWALKLIIDKLNDEKKTVSIAALELLHEACEDQDYLLSLYQQISTPTNNYISWLNCIKKIGFNAYLLNIKFYSLSTIFHKLPSPLEEFDKWIKPGGFNETYVHFIEGIIHDSFTCRQKSDNGQYIRRKSNKLILPKDVFIPPHIFGQFVKHEHGLQIITRKNIIQILKRFVQRFSIDYGGACGGNDDNNTFINKPFIDDTYIMSEESGNEESNRLETIIDNETIETSTSTSTTETYNYNDNNNLNIDDKILRVKAAIWSFGHVGTSSAGVDILKHYGIIDILTNIAETCQYYSVRATAVYSMCLISTTKFGADALTSYGWPCVRYKRGDYWPIVMPTTSSYTIPSPVPIQKHHRSLSDGKPDIPEINKKRTRNRSESAATDIENRKFGYNEHGDTPSPVSSIQRLSQQDADGYAKLRSLQRYRRPNYSKSTSEMYSYDDKLSLQNLAETGTSNDLIFDNFFTTTLPTVSTDEEDTNENCHLGICLPKNLESIFPYYSSKSSIEKTNDNFQNDNNNNNNNDNNNIINNNSDSDNNDRLNFVDYDSDDDGAAGAADDDVDDDDNANDEDDEKHWKICLICQENKSTWNSENYNDTDIKIKRKILRYVQRLSNPIKYRQNRRALLRLRQSNPKIFQDTCLFCEVASRLGTGTYRLSARILLQELFLDLEFNQLYNEPKKILNIPELMKAVDETPTDNVIHKNPMINKINGKIIINNNDESLTTTTTTSTSQLNENTITVDKKICLKIPETTIKKSDNKLSDEEIIADILKPEKHKKISKTSDNKLLKVTGTKTAISLD
ncbi:hypothetical protein HCN44_003269 [Aphidius gifuensis]|uniref:Uncharacterized protein n=1 Tax=Aphidius gifuensis TaxID=684658 RepID=A0A834XIL2_APHGI|nr:hypothetical protein HCN44_003269 [Aphidius gifuensis]